MELISLASTSLLLTGVSALIGLVAFGLISLAEREKRAAVVAFILAVLTPLPLLTAAILSPAVGASLLGLLGILAAVLFFLPLGAQKALHGRPTRRVDERDIMFARAHLVPGSPEFESYYAMRPENRESDDRTRALPGLYSPDAAMADSQAFASALASEAVVRSLRPLVDGALASQRTERPAAESTAEIKRLALDLGALDVGVTELRPYHVYSHVGRGAGIYGEPIDLDHRWAVTITMEMDYEPLRHAPAGPVIAESTRLYAASGKLAVELAAKIRSMGYPARAHIDGNYRVIAPLVAWDAGLGEIGRMGILMTPRVGPRVRIAVVTTDLPLLPDAPGDDPSMIDFCTVCKKCADNCPSESIPFGDRERVDGAWRWKIDADSCFRYWNAIGTDCGRCLTVCPYSHPDSAAHNLLRVAIRRSAVARRASLRLDDLFYGRKPRARRQRPRG